MPLVDLGAPSQTGTVAGINWAVEGSGTGWLTPPISSYSYYTGAEGTQTWTFADEDGDASATFNLDFVIGGFNGPGEAVTLPEGTTCATDNLGGTAITWNETTRTLAATNASDNQPQGAVGVACQLLEVTELKLVGSGGTGFSRGLFSLSVEFASGNGNGAIDDTPAQGDIQGWRQVGGTWVFGAASPASHDVWQNAGGVWLPTGPGSSVVDGNAPK